MPRSFPHLALAAATAGALFVGILAGIVVPFRAEERALYDQAFIGRDAEVLNPVAQQQVAESEVAEADSTADPSQVLMPVLLRSSEQEDMYGVAIFDPEGSIIQPSAMLLLPDLSSADYSRLLATGGPISHYTPNFSLDRYFSGKHGVAPVLEILLPLRGHDATKPLGFIEYYKDARTLAQQLADSDHRFNRETAVTLAFGAALIALVLAGAYFGLRRAQRLIADRNDRLTRANFELTLAAKASALGQITSHLIHGLQGPVAGLRAVMAERASDGGASSDWKSASDYTERLQGIIQETVALLGDTGAQISYALTGQDLADTIRRRNRAAAADKTVVLEVVGDLVIRLDSHRGSLLCLIATNLVQNAIAATSPGRRVDVTLRNADGAIALFVTDRGSGIPEEFRAHLFEPGRSGRPGGTGLGLAISQLLARQIGASLTLLETGPGGTTFRLTLPL